MEQRNNFLFLITLLIAGCGVKGVPLPPLVPAPIGRGEPTYSEATQKSSKDKKKEKNVNKNQDPEEISTAETQEDL